jgi:shikimate dehydrogenase
MHAPRTFLQGLVGVFGNPVAENPTQAMIEPAFAAMGLDWRYLTVEVLPDGLADAVRGARAMGWKGFNCTIPHKVAVVPLLDGLAPAAELIGAVNCVIVRDGVLIGENTDGKGFLESLRPVRPVAGVRAVLLGAGGAARAIGVELGLAGAGRITVVNRCAERGVALATHLYERTQVPVDFVKWEGKYSVPENADVLIQATSIGLFPDVEAEVPLVAETLRPGLVVCDVIPNPPRTRLVHEAEARGCTVLDGLGMLVNQGVIGIRLWTGREPDSSVMRRALDKVFNS